MKPRRANRFEELLITDVCTRIDLLIDFGDDLREVVQCPERTTFGKNEIAGDLNSR